MFKKSIVNQLASQDLEFFINSLKEVMYSQTCIIRPSLIRLIAKPPKNGLEPIFLHRKQC